MMQKIQQALCKTMLNPGSSNFYPRVTGLKCSYGKIFSPLRQIDRQIETLLKCQKPSSQGKKNPLLIWGHQLGENIQTKNYIQQQVKYLQCYLITRFIVKTYRSQNLTKIPVGKTDISGLMSQSTLSNEHVKNDVTKDLEVRREPAWSTGLM